MLDPKHPMICYLNGSFMPIAEASLPLTDLGILRGFSVFDFLRTYNGKPFRLDDHIRRLRHSANQIGLSISQSNETIAEIVYEVLAKNNDRPEWAIRILATGGISENHFLPIPNRNTLAVMVEPVTDTRDSPLHQTGVSIVTTRGTRELPTVKSTNYVSAIMATQTAQRSGAVEALHVDEHGMVSEGTRTNIFFVLPNDEIVTAPENVLLEGVTRKVLIELLQKKGSALSLSIRPISLEEASTAKEAFLTSSTKELLPVIAMDGRPIGTGAKGPITTQCHSLFREYAWDNEDTA